MQTPDRFWTPTDTSTNLRPPEAPSPIMPAMDGDTNQQQFPSHTLLPSGSSSPTSSPSAPPPRRRHPSGLLHALSHLLPHQDQAAATAPTPSPPVNVELAWLPPALAATSTAAAATPLGRSAPPWLLGASTPPVPAAAAPSAPAAFLRWASRMTGTYFPLLRTSPATGTGSYGALPVSYQGSDASSDSSDAGSELSAPVAPSADERETLLATASVGETLPAAAVAAADVSHNWWEGPRTRRRNRGPASLHKPPGSTQTSNLLSGNAAAGDDDRAPPVFFDVQSSGEDSGDDDQPEDDDDPPDNSPYPEVRASVLATDDDSLSINTPRMWTLSLLFTLVGSSTNLFFSLRYPSISITPVIALLLAHPLGKLWDRAFPESPDGDGDSGDDGDPTVAATPLPSSKVGRGRFEQFAQWLGRGRWNRKEHACVYISSNVSFGFAFATDVSLESFPFSFFSFRSFLLIPSHRSLHSILFHHISFIIVVVRLMAVSAD